MKKSMKLLAAGALGAFGLFAAAAAPAKTFPDWSVEAMTYAPDRGYKGAAEKHYFENWGWRDEKGEPIQFYPKYFTEGGMLEISFIYRGKDRKLPPLELVLDGQRQSETMKRPDRNVVWYRITPSSPLPGQVIRLAARFRAHPGKPVKLQLTAKDKVLFEKEIDLAALPRSPLVRATMDESMKRINFFVRCSGSPKLEKVLFDGADFTGRVSVGRSCGGITPAVLDLPEALIRGTRHTLIFRCGGVSCGYDFQAHDNRFRFGIYAGPHPENMKWHHFDLLWDHGSTPVERILWNYRHGISSIFMLNGDYERYRDVPGVLADYLTDEPDVGDFMHYPKINPAYLRLGSNAPALNEMVARKNANAQSLLNLSTIDGTFKPGEYYNYARITDVVVMDPYAVSAGRKVTEVYDLGNVVRAANEPGIFWSLIGCYAYKKAHWKRFPNRDELHYMVRGAVAAGTQTVGYWMYPDGSLTYGPISSPETWRTMGLVNGELKTAAHLLCKSCPAEIAMKLPAGTDARLLRTVDDEASLLFFINTGCVSDAKGITIPPVGTFRAELPLPAGVTAAAVFRMTLDGPRRVPDFSVADGKVSFDVEGMTHSAFYVIAHHAAAAEKLEKIWETAVKPNHLMAEKLFRGKTRAPQADLREWLVLTDSRMIAPEAETGGAPETVNGAFLDYFQGQSYRRAGEKPMTIRWSLPAEAGDLYLPYSSEEMVSVELSGAGDAREELILEPSRRCVVKIACDGTKKTMKLTLRDGVSGRALFFVPRKAADAPRKIVRDGKPFISGDEPYSKEKAEALCDGNFIKGPRWSNSRNRLAKITPVIGCDFDVPRKLTHLLLCGWNNRSYGMKSVSGKVTFADGSVMELPERRGFTGGSGIWYRKYIFWWELPDKAVKRIELSLAPAPFLWIDAGEIVCLARD